MTTNCHCAGRTLKSDLRGYVSDDASEIPAHLSFEEKTQIQITDTAQNCNSAETYWPGNLKAADI